MSSRVSLTILLCEDRAHATLVSQYLGLVGVFPRSIRRIVASEKGGNVDWVLSSFPEQLQACRHRHKAKANTLLITVVDADNRTVDERHRMFVQRGLSPSDPVAFLIPKRNVETWIRAALGEPVNETDDYKMPKLTSEDIKRAAKVIHDWVHREAPTATIVDSLQSSLSVWRKIG